MFLHSLSSFLCKHCICGHKCDYSIVDMPSLRSARYICLAANSICFRYAQARYDIDPRSRSEHIECVSTYRTRQRISKIRASGSISTRSVLKGTTLMNSFFCAVELLVLDRVNGLASCDVPYGEEAGESRNEYADREHKDYLSYTEVEQRNIQTLLTDEVVKHLDRGEGSDDGKNIVDKCDDKSLGEEDLEYIA